MRTTDQPQVIRADGGVRTIDFRYDLLNADNEAIGDITDLVRDCTIDYNSLADIQRTARIRITDSSDIDYAIDRIKPWVILESDGVSIELPMGVFLLPTPEIATDDQGTATRDIEAYDQMLVLRQDMIASRYAVTAGTNYAAAVTTILADTDGVTSWNIAPTDKALPTGKEWPPGTAKVDIINELLTAINYGALFFDEDGTAVAQPYVSPATKASEWTYAANETSIVYEQASRTIDLFDVPNRWVLVVSDADRPPLVGSYTNTDPDSPTSTLARGRTITDFRESEDAADQASLDLKAFALAVEASQVHEHVAFTTALNPLHSHADVYTVQFDTLGLAAKFGETEWSMSLETGAKMSHLARRVVSLEAS